MKAPEWLFGKPGYMVDWGGGHGLEPMIMRPMSLEPDTVRELVVMIGRDCGGARLVWQDDGSEDGDPHKPIEPAELENTPAWQLRHLHIFGADGWSVTMRDDMLHVSGPLTAGGTHEALHRAVVEKLTSEGVPRLPRWRIRRAAGRVAFTVVAALVVLILVLARLPFLVNALVVVLAGLAIHTAWRVDHNRRAVVEPPHPSGAGSGARIRQTSRVQDRQRRADRQAALKQFAITAPITAVIGAVVGFLVARL